VPFLSTRDSREASQNLSQASFVEEASFSETFAAGVGQVFDEELSISSMLNMEGFNQRKSQVKELGDSGAFNISNYTSPVGDVDYERISTDFPDFKIKNDQALFDERKSLLKRRREYSQDVFDRGNGMAQFLGMATGYMLDPINIATMPIATAGVAVKGLGTLGRAITIGKNEAGLAVAAELMIQPLVYQHKHDIDSPFEFKDALINIATAATGAAVIGSAVGGISGYIKAVREKTVDLPLDDDAVMSLGALARVEDDLNIINSKTKPEKASVDRAKEQGFNVDNVVYHGTDRDFSEFDVSKAGERGEDFGNYVYFSSDPDVASGFSVSLTKSENFNKALKKAELARIKRNKAIVDFGVNSKEHIEAQELVEIAEANRAKVYDQANEFAEPTTGSNVRPSYLKGDYLEFDAKGKHYSKVNETAISAAKDQGKDGVIIKNSFDRSTTKSKKQSDVTVVFDANNIRSKFDTFEKIKSDGKIISELNDKMETVNQPSKVKENYIQPERKTATTGSVTQREREVIERNGLTQDYDADIEAFKSLDNPRIIQDDQVVDANDFMKSIDDEINGIDDVLRCVIG